MKERKEVKDKSRLGCKRAEEGERIVDNRVKGKGKESIGEKGSKM